MQIDKSPAFLMIFEAFTHINGALISGRRQVVKDVLSNYPELQSELRTILDELGAGATAPDQAE